MLVPLDDGLWEADARAELEDVAEEIDEKLGDIDEDVDTLGGLAFVIAGRVPEPGEILMHDQSGWKLEILASDGRRVTRLRLHPPIKRAVEEEG
ncbi:MAG: transporter associated domain-containing protein, partial [Alphaproteobacteria bacterium]